MALFLSSAFFAHWGMSGPFQRMNGIALVARHGYSIVMKTTAQRSKELRERRKADGLAEVRGLLLPLRLHQAFKNRFYTDCKEELARRKGSS
jgi:hypothetical protein